MPFDLLLLLVISLCSLIFEVLDRGEEGEISAEALLLVRLLTDLPLCFGLPLGLRQLLLLVFFSFLGLFLFLLPLSWSFLLGCGRLLF